MIKKVLSISILLFTSLSLFSLDPQECFPEVDKELMVYDVEGILSESQEASLNDKLINFSNSSSNQIAVIITDRLCGLEPEQYATQIGHYYGVGQGDFDNGVVLLVSPNLKKTHIAVGYGLEGAIPDITCGQIVRNELIPNFKEKNFYNGIEKGVAVLMSLANGEYSYESYGNSAGTDKFPVRFLTFFFIFFGIIILSFVVALKRAWDYAKLNNIGLWAAYILLSNEKRKHGGRYGDFSSGGGGYGGGYGGFGGGGGGFGGGGGGFGGFGGGGFGGGGAGGSW